MDPSEMNETAAAEIAILKTLFPPNQYNSIIIRKDVLSGTYEN